MRNNINRIITSQNHGYNIESHMISNGGFTTLVNARKVYNLSSPGRCKQTGTATKRWLNQIAIPIGFVRIDENSNRKTMLYMHRDLNNKFGSANNFFSLLNGLNRMFNYSLFNNNLENRKIFNKRG